MKLDVRALAITFALICGGCVFITAAAHRMWPSYGTDFLNVVASVYPGYSVGGLKSGLVAAVYALVDGAVAGALVATIYNAVGREGGRGQTKAG